MSLALGTRVLGEEAGVDTWLAVLERLDVRGVRVDPSRAHATAGHAQQAGRQLREAGVRIHAWAPDAPAALATTPDVRARVAAWLDEATAMAGSLGARHVVLDLGVSESVAADEIRITQRAALREGAPVAGEVHDAWLSAREAQSPRLLEAIAPVLHASLRRGTPLALRVGAHAGARLAPLECGWLLDDLPGLAVWADPIRLAGLQEAGLGVAPATWLEPHAARIVGVEVSGRDSHGEAGRHPEDMPLPWSTLIDVVPAASAWTLDLAPGTDEALVRDAVAWARDRLP